MANEKRLIDANALKEYLMTLEASGGHKYYRKGMDDTLHYHMPHIIDDAPTVDAVEVVHGRWEEQKEWDFKARDYFLAGYTCSCCGFWYLNQQKYNYCPNCGAKMDGEKENR